jgi:DNA-binding beta-propeller fold protein YncE/cytochrome c553
MKLKHTLAFLSTPLFLMMILSLILSACMRSPQESETPGAQFQPGELPMVKGKQVQAFYLDSCSGCHAPDRRGATGPALLPERLTQPDEYYHGVIKNGKPGTIMPPWGGQLSDEEIDTLISFIRSDVAAEAKEWDEEDIWASLTVITPEDQLPSEPQMKMNLDNLMLVTEREAQSIAVIDADTHTLIGKIPASYRAHGYAFHPTNPRWVLKIDLYNLKPVRKIRIGLDARSVAISDDGKWLIAGNYMPATLVILNAETLELVKYLPTKATDNEGEEIESRVATILDTSPDLVGPYFLVALKEAGQVWRIDWSKPDFPMVALEKVGHVLHDGFLSEDNRTFYLAAQQDDWMAAIDVESMTVIKDIVTGDVPHPGSGAAWTVDGIHYAATTHAGEGKVTIWDTDTNEIVATVETPGPGLFLRVQENSPYVWADSVFAEQPNAITVFEKTPPFKVVKVITDGKRTLHPEFTSDGKFVYVADWDGNVVRVYDASSLELVKEIDGITTPTGVFNTVRRAEPLGH